jgi:hypothetical protein
MVIGKIGGYLALGLVGAFLLNSLIRPQAAFATGEALSATGGGIGSIGQGIGSSLASIGEGAAKLFNPLFTLRDLVFSSDVSGGANVSPVANTNVRIDPVIHDLHPGSSTVTTSSGADSPTSSYTGSGYVGARGVASYLR